jgi:hypothetical protein
MKSKMAGSFILSFYVFIIAHSCHYMPMRRCLSALMDFQFSIGLFPFGVILARPFLALKRKSIHSPDNWKHFGGKNCHFLAERQL